MAEKNLIYCGTELQELSAYYKDHVHGYASLAISVLGVVANSLNVIVFSRKELISPVNTVLGGLALADLVVSLDYIPFGWYMCSIPKHPHRDRFTYNWAVVILWHSIFSQIFHTIANWQAVVLAVWRYIAVVHPLKEKRWCDTIATRRAVLSGFLVCPLLCLPLVFSFYIQPRTMMLNESGYAVKNESTGINSTLYFVSMRKTDFLLKFNFLTYSVLFKIVPSIALTTLSLRFVWVLIRSKRKRSSLTTRSREKENQTDRITTMLLTVLFLFLLAEVPQGILGLLSIIIGEQVFYSCYRKLEDFLDIMALTNSSLNFVVYYFMSTHFRISVKEVLGCARKSPM